MKLVEDVANILNLIFERYIINLVHFRFFFSILSI